MTPAEKRITSGMITRLLSLLEQEEAFFFKERPFLMTGEKAVHVELSDEDKRKKEQVSMDIVGVCKAYSSLIDKKYPVKQGTLC